MDRVPRGGLTKWTWRDPCLRGGPHVSFHGALEWLRNPFGLARHGPAGCDPPRHAGAAGCDGGDAMAMADAIVGYARVSSVGQSLDVQRAVLAYRGKLFEETRPARPRTPGTSWPRV